jgi:hypothetical protein
LLAAATAPPSRSVADQPAAAAGTVLCIVAADSPARPSPQSSGRVIIPMISQELIAPGIFTATTPAI